MRNEREISDKVAISIRHLWHIESMDEKKKIIRKYDNLYRLFLLVDNHPDLFTSEELNKYQTIRANLSEFERDLMGDIFTVLHMGLVTEPLEYTVEEVKAFYSKGLYFTEEEIQDMISWQLYGAEKHNPELVILLGEYLDKHLYFDTVEEAEKVWDEYFDSHPNEDNKN